MRAGRAANGPVLANRLNGSLVKTRHTQQCILLHKVLYHYVTLFDVYECAINPDLLKSRIRTLTTPRDRVAICAFCSRM